MPNEMNNDRRAEARWWNFKYPFLRIKDNSTCPWNEENSDDVCWFDEIPFGWVKAFGKEMCDELLATLGKYVDDFIILQMKEKFGELRVYWAFEDKDYTATETEEIGEIQLKVHNIIDKYASISARTCVECGKEAVYMTEQWVLPYCAECAPEDAKIIKGDDDLSERIST